MLLLHNTNTMPAKSERQRRLFGIAYAVRQGKTDRNTVGPSVLDIVDSDMTNDEILDFAKAVEEDKMQTLSMFAEQHLRYDK